MKLLNKIPFHHLQFFFINIKIENHCKNSFLSWKILQYIFLNLKNIVLFIIKKAYICGTIENKTAVYEEPGQKKKRCSSDEKGFETFKCF